MARNRMLNPEFWLDEEVAKLTPFARLLYMGLWGICDDNYATFPDRPEWIKAQVFPYDTVDIKKLLGELEKTVKIIPFEFENKKFWYLKNFFKHQRVEKPSKPKYPQYSGELPNYSPTTPAEAKRSKVKRKEDNNLFDLFYKSYPKKVARVKAEQSWNKIDPDEKLFNEIMAGLERYKKCSQWTKDDGQFIPHPTTWLNQKRWNDEVEVPIIKEIKKF